MARDLDLMSMFDGLHRLLTTSSRDWSEYGPDAWLYGVLVGWEGDALAEVSARHGWDTEAVDKLARYRSAVLDTQCGRIPSTVLSRREGVDLTPLTLAELRLRFAQLTTTAERLRIRSQVGDPTTRRTASLSRDARVTQRRADDYAAVLAAIEGGGL